MLIDIYNEIVSQEKKGLKIALNYRDNLELRITCGKNMRKAEQVKVKELLIDQYVLSYFTLSPYNSYETFCLYGEKQGPLLTKIIKKFKYIVSKIPKKAYEDKEYSLVVSLESPIEKDELPSALIFFLNAFNNKLADSEKFVNEILA